MCRYSPLGVDERLLSPSQAVADDAVHCLQAVDVLFIDRDVQYQRVADLHVLGHRLVGRVGVDAHRTAGHRRRGRQRGRADLAATQRRNGSVRRGEVTSPTGGDVTRQEKT